MNDNELLGWHFLCEGRRLAYPPHTLVEVGQTLRMPDNVAPVLCERGFHASVKILDALKYAPLCEHLVLTRVRLGGTRIVAADKVVASERTCLAMVPADTILHEFACWCAEGALLGSAWTGHKIDDRSWNAIVAKRAWMRGEIDDEMLAVARAVARAAAGAAAWTAARTAAEDAAGAAAWTAAEDAAWDAAWTAAEDAAWTAAEDAANDELERRMLQAMEGGHDARRLRSGL